MKLRPCFLVTAIWRPRTHVCTPAGAACALPTCMPMVVGFPWLSTQFCNSGIALALEQTVPDIEIIALQLLKKSPVWLPWPQPAFGCWLILWTEASHWSLLRYIQSHKLCVWDMHSRYPIVLSLFLFSQLIKFKWAGSQQIQLPWKIREKAGHWDIQAKPSTISGLLASTSDNAYLTSTWFKSP